jgi:hypothetical protein
MREHPRFGAQPIVVFNRGATSVPNYPGLMIAPADATRTHLTIQTSGIQLFTVYPRSGSDPPSGAGITLYPYSGSLEMNDRDDPDLVVAEWWAYSSSQRPAALEVTEEILR